MKWIPVEDRLPEDGSIVDIYVIFPNSGHGGGLRIPDVIYDDREFKREIDKPYHNVTHWMPLPESPKPE